MRCLLLLAIIGITLRILVPERTSTSRGDSAWIEEQGTTMGSTYRILFAASTDLQDKASISQLVLELRAILNATDQQISTWNPKSQLSRFNAQTSTDWVEVDQHTVPIVELAQELHVIDPRFDVTVAPLSELWGFGPRNNNSARSGQEPAPAEIDDWLQHVGSHKLESRREPPALRKQDPLLQVDLSALAAGFVVDRIAQQLIARGVVDFYIDVAGEIMVGGKNRSGEKWRVGIAKPVVGSSALHSVLQLSDCAIATSGNYRKFAEVKGRKLGHILDPRTGWPADSDVLSATVIDASCARADGIATLLMTMPAASGIELANRHEWAVLLITADGQLRSESADRLIPEPLSASGIDFN